jgi:ribonuclease VapC
MIVVDTSALMAIVLNEAEAGWCADVLETEREVLISAATLAEALIVGERRHVAEEVAELVEGLGFVVVPVSEAAARRAAQAYSFWGKGQHSAGLNFGDCFSYALAQDTDCPLLYVGDDFARTDIRAAGAR